MRRRLSLFKPRNITHFWSANTTRANFGDSLSQRAIFAGEMRTGEVYHTSATIEFTIIMG